MNHVIRFLTPRLVGARFAGHAVPVGLFKDLDVLEKMIIEVAKWCYLKDHPECSRVPKGFSDGVSLKLSGVVKGSAVLEFDLVRMFLLKGTFWQLYLRHLTDTNRGCVYFYRG